MGSADGEIVTVNTRYMDIDKKAKTHKLAITSCNFTCDDRFLLTGSADHFYEFSANVKTPGRL